MIQSSIFNSFFVTFLIGVTLLRRTALTASFLPQHVHVQQNSKMNNISEQGLLKTGAVKTHSVARTFFFALLNRSVSTVPRNKIVQCRPSRIKQVITMVS